MRPSDFSYKHEARHNSCLVVAQLWENVEDSDEALLKDLTRLSYHAKGCEFGNGLDSTADLSPRPRTGYTRPPTSISIPLK